MNEPLRRLQWQDSDTCQICNSSFSFFSRRKHHCRDCGMCVCADCSSLRNKPEKNVRLCDRCVAERSKSVEIQTSTPKTKGEPSRLHRKQYAFGTKERQKVLSHVLKSRENDPFPACGELDTIASDGTSHQVRQPDYTKTRQKGPSKSALYQLVGSKLFKSNSTYGKKLTNVSQRKDLFQCLLKEWTQSLESGCSTDVLMEHIDEDVEE